MDKLERALMEEAQNEIAEVSKMDLGDEKHKITANVIGQFTDRIIELEKIKLEQQRIDAENKKADIDAERIIFDKKDSKVKNGIAIGTAAASLIVTVGGVLMTFAFDMEHTPTSTLGKQLLNRLIPTKK